MFWIFLGDIFFVLGVILLKYTEGASLIIVLFGLVVIFLPISYGITVYPNFIRDRVEIQSLYYGIDTIRSAHYTEVKSGELVGGSLDNMQQSKVLSEYLITYIQKKAIFNSNLTKAKIRKNMQFYRWFLDGQFISAEINNLKEL